MASPPPHPALELYRRHVNPSFVKLLGVLGFGRIYTSAEGVWITDDQGRRYLDLLAGFGAVNVGHHHPRLHDAIRRFFEERPLNLAHIGPSVHEAELAGDLAGRLGHDLQRILLSSSGSEAVEAAIKLARAATGRAGIVYATGGFHGTNLGTLSIMGDRRMRSPFEPLLADCTQIPYGDLAALEAALAKRTVAAVVLEPILAEGGVVLPAPGWLRQVQRRCEEAGTLLVLDEVQTGLGRTGEWFAFEHEGFVPHIVCLGKALSGSLVPISATATRPDLHDRAYGTRDRFDLHSSTFGGNALSCVVARETLAILDEEGLVANAAARGEQLLAGLRRRLAGHPFIRDIRGRGLLVGIELGPTDQGLVNKLAPSAVRAVSKQVFGQWAALRLLEAGVISQPASLAWNVLRLEPPLTISEAEISLAIDRVAGVFEAYPTLSGLMKDVVQRVGVQYAGGWSFR